MLSIFSEKNGENSNDLSVIDSFDEKVLNLTTLNSQDERVDNWISILKWISENPEMIKHIKNKYSEQIWLLSENEWFWEWIKKVIEFVNTFNNSTYWVKITEKWWKNFDFMDLFDYNNPTILIWLIASLSKEKVNYSSKNKILDEYLNQIREDYIISLIKQFEKLDTNWDLLKPFIKELVLFSVRHIQLEINIKEKINDKNLSTEELCNEDSYDYDYWHNMWSIGDYVDLENYINTFDKFEYNVKSNTLDENLDIISEQYSFWKEWLKYKEIWDIFENIEIWTPTYILLDVIKTNYEDIFFELLNELENYTINFLNSNMKVLTWKSSRLFHERINWYINEKPEKIKKQVVWYLFNNWIYSTNTWSKIEKLLNNNQNLKNNEDSETEDDEDFNLFDGNL